MSFCLDHVAMVPEVPTPSSSEWKGDRPGDSNGNVRPVYYLALNEVDPTKRNEIHSVEAELDKSYHQVRQLTLMDRNRKKERIRDLLGSGIAAYSPFHLVGFTSNAAIFENCHDVNDPSHAENDRNVILPMKGRVEGALSNDGGMHRSFRQRVHLSLDVSSNAAAANTPQMMKINATVFLPLMETVFVDADDPFIVNYDVGSKEGSSCKVSVGDDAAKHRHGNDGNGGGGNDEDGINSIFYATTSECNIHFLASETVDIEQPSFASRQYVVAFQLDATVQLSYESHDSVKTSSLSSSAKESMGALQIYIDYGTTLHTRYQLPIGPTIENNESDTCINIGSSGSVAQKDLRGFVPIVIQQPILYSASVSTTEERVSSSTDKRFFNQRIHVLRTDLSSSGYDVDGEHIYTTPPNPIIIHVAAGFDDDYWWVTLATMSTVLFGGLVLMKSMDLVSTWR